MIRYLTFFAIAFLKLNAAEGVLLPNEALPADQTRYWSPGMSLCWEEAKSAQGFTIAKPDPAGNLKQLDKIQADPTKILPKDSYFIYSGPADGETEQIINQTLRTRWPKDAKPVKIPAMLPGSIFSFAYFNHQFRYKRRFYRSKKSGLNFKVGDAEREVGFFGIKGKVAAEYPVEVLNYGEEGKSYTLEIPGQDPNQSLVLMMEPDILSFEKALTRLTELRKGYSFLPTKSSSPNYLRLHEKDDLRIPFVDFKAETNFQPSFSGAILNKQDAEALPWRIAHAKELAQFTMDEFGAKVIVQAEMGYGFGFASPKPVPFPRKFYFNKPFYVSLWMKDTTMPYFIARIANFEDLELFKATK